MLGSRTSHAYHLQQHHSISENVSQRRIQRICQQSHRVQRDSYHGLDDKPKAKLAGNRWWCVPLREDIMGKVEGGVRSLPLIDVADSEVHKATARPNCADNKSGRQFRAT